MFADAAAWAVLRDKEKMVRFLKSTGVPVFEGLQLFKHCLSKKGDGVRF